MSTGLLPRRCLLKEGKQSINSPATEKHLLPHSSWEVACQGVPAASQCCFSVWKPPPGLSALWVILALSATLCTWAPVFHFEQDVSPGITAPCQNLLMPTSVFLWIRSEKFACFQSKKTYSFLVVSEIKMILFSMSAQLWEFPVKAGTFKRQGSCGTRSHKVTWLGPSLPHLIKCSQTKVPLGGPRKAPPLNENEELFADSNDYHIKWIFPKKIMEN